MEPVPARLAAHGWSLRTGPVYPYAYPRRRGVVDDHYVILDLRSLLTGDLQRQWRLYLADGFFQGFGESRPWEEAQCEVCGPFGSLREAVSALTGVEL